MKRILSLSIAFMAWCCCVACFFRIVEADEIKKAPVIVLVTGMAVIGIVVLMNKEKK